MTVEDGDTLLGSLVSNQGVSSDDKIVSGRIKLVDRAEDREVVEALEE